MIRNEEPSKLGGTVMRKVIATVAAIALIAASLAGCVRAESSASPDNLAAVAAGDTVTMQPTDMPTLAPTATETPTPTAIPTVRPTVRPTVQSVPTVAPAMPVAPQTAEATAVVSAPPQPVNVNPTLEPGATLTPRPLPTGRLGWWSGTGPAVVQVTGDAWTEARMSWACAVPGVFEMQPLISTNSQSGGSDIMLINPGQPTIGPVTITGDASCAWVLSIS
jgi:hypothetical protein